MTEAKVLDYVILVASWVVGAFIFRSAVLALLRRAIARWMRTASGASPQNELTAPMMPVASPPQFDVAMLKKRHRRRTAVYIIAGTVQAVASAGVALYLVDPSAASLRGLSVLAVFMILPGLITSVLLLFSPQGQVSSAGIWVVSALFGFAFSLFFTSSMMLLRDEDFRPGALTLNAIMGLFVVPALVLGLIGLKSALRRALNMSPEMDAIVTTWLVAALVQMIIWRHGEHPGWALAIPLGHLGFLGVVAIGFRSLRTSASPIDLLYLRNFDPARGGSALRRIARWWTELGRVHLITGVDTAPATLDSGALGALLTGRLRRRFIRTPADLEQRIRRLQDRPNRDGRFDVISIPCTENMWRATVIALMGTAAAIVADVRGLQTANEGARYELLTLRNLGLVPRTVILTDRKTDQNALREALGDERPAEVVVDGGLQPIEVVVAALDCVRRSASVKAKT